MAGRLFKLDAVRDVDSYMMPTGWAPTWACECGHANGGDRCFLCGSSRPTGAMPNAVPPVDSAPTVASPSATRPFAKSQVDEPLPAVSLQDPPLVASLPEGSPAVSRHRAGVRSLEKSFRVRRPSTGVEGTALASRGEDTESVQAAPSVDAGLVEMRPVAALIALNVVFGIVMYFANKSGTLEPDQAIRYGVYGGIVLFVAGLVVAIDRVITAQLRIFWQWGGAVTGASIGVITGLSLAFGVTELTKAATHRPFIEESAALLVSGGGWGRIALAVLVTAIMAPFVEELVFRGIFAQSLRRRGWLVAVGVSSSTFAVAHLRFGVQ